MGRRDNDDAWAEEETSTRRWGKGRGDWEMERERREATSGGRAEVLMLILFNGIL